MLRWIRWIAWRQNFHKEGLVIAFSEKEKVGEGGIRFRAR